MNVKNRFFARWTVVFLIAAIILGIGYLFLPERDTPKETRLVYTVRFENLRQKYELQQGDTAYAGYAMGNVISQADYTPYAVYEYNSDKNVIEAKQYQDKYSMTVSLVADAVYEKEVGYSVSGVRIAVGESIKLRFPSFSGQGDCIEIREAEQGEE